jgi:hypothetical protein
VDAALLIVALTLVLVAFTPVATEGSTSGELRRRVARQVQLWDSYLGELQPWKRPR